MIVFCPDGFFPTWNKKTSNSHVLHVELLNRKMNKLNYCLLCYYEYTNLNVEMVNERIYLKKNNFCPCAFFMSSPVTASSNNTFAFATNGFRELHA